MARFCLLTGCTKDEYLRLTRLERAAFEQAAKQMRRR